MKGLMQDWPLLTHKVVEHAARNHGHREIVTYTVEGGVHRTNYAQVEERARKLAQALKRLGVGHGDRVASLAWNTWRHLELWYGVSGMGAVMHTVNPRLFHEQLEYIFDHAGDRVVFVDLTFVPIMEAVMPTLSSAPQVVVMTDAAHMPRDAKIDGLLCYEDLIAAEDGRFEWPDLDERDACGLCYTSGTTGNPKGVLYSHRSTVLHTMACCTTDTLGIAQRDSILPVVPMFHANAWGIPYAAAMMGSRLVFNGPHHDGATLQQVIEDEQVTLSAAVPTVWLGLLDYLRNSGKRINRLHTVTIGGSAAPRHMIQAFQDEYGVRVNHAWGMTELSPLGTVGTMTAETAEWDKAAQLDLQCKQGRAIFGVELKIEDENGEQKPRDGRSQGHLKVRGPWVVQTYYNYDGPPILDNGGWFDTGDVSTLDDRGYMQITDRSKDVIKSGGEWISSIDLENLAAGHPAVLEAAVIALPHPKWDERPLLVLVPRDGAAVAPDEVRAFMGEHVAKWQLPDDIVFVDELPHSATGKIQKTALRERFKDHVLPTV
ncbi:long-chain fatty acid--CoA ligase [Rhodothalassium salexigens]|uniref:long-chain-fatty-acid--CoA ligase n=1 Tax=Rhodothalassium salexigens TaxID=1086 RepID=UPI001912F2A7|nr:long-chain-fatty-acid--CoA ligase [Rhodothalassium salexigens]MBK5910728.1 long-chain fatty acid--CoA ligase [Rhodothalassium salexigens]